MSKPTSPTDEREATREEVISALLHPEQPEANELGQTAPGDDEPPLHASPREQAAAPINVLKVDE